MLGLIIGPIDVYVAFLRCFTSPLFFFYMMIEIACSLNPWILYFFCYVLISGMSWLLINLLLYLYMCAAEPTVTFGHTDNSMHARSFGNPGVNADERRYQVPTFSGHLPLISLFDWPTAFCPRCLKFWYLCSANNECFAWSWWPRSISFWHVIWRFWRHGWWDE